MSAVHDTIAGIATASGPAGIGIVRVTGPDAIAIATALTGLPAARLRDRVLVRAVVRDASGRRLDDGLVVAMRAPATFTGDDTVELQVHGGAVNLGNVLAAAAAAGARLAQPGEMTRRALAAGKIGVLEAEAMMAVVGARTVRAWALAQAHLGGGAAATVAALRTDATAIVAELEAHLDFPEEDLPPVSRDRLHDALAALAARTTRLADSFGAGRALTEGLRVAIVGAVNAGKSALLNALLGRERALVSPAAGTTRDYLEASVVWDGVAVTLVDTAGWRAGADDLESRGIALGQSRAAECDVVVHVVGPRDAEGSADVAGSSDRGGTRSRTDARVVVDSPEATDAPGDADASSVAADRAIAVASKIDLGWHPPAGLLPTSAVRGDGIDALRAAILARAGLADDPEAGSAVLLTERQRDAAATAARGFRSAGELLASSSPLELVAVEARAGLTALAALAGERIGEDVLDALFARFCIGK